MFPGPLYVCGQLTHHKLLLLSPQHKDLLRSPESADLLSVSGQHCGALAHTLTLTRYDALTPEHSSAVRSTHGNTDLCISSLLSPLSSHLSPLAFLLSPLLSPLSSLLSPLASPLSPFSSLLSPLSSLLSPLPSRLSPLPSPLSSLSVIRLALVCPLCCKSVSTTVSMLAC